MLHGPIFKSLIDFAVPVFISMLLQSLYSTVDSMIVGACWEKNALAAVGIGGIISDLLIGFVNGAGMGMALILTRRYGANDTEGIKRSVAASLVIGLILYVLTSLAGPGDAGYSGSSEHAGRAAAGNLQLCPGDHCQHSGVLSV